MFENHQIDRLPDETQRTIKMGVYLPDKDDEAYGVAVDLAGDQMTGSSKRRVLFALQQLRRRHDERRILVDCYGASENVYPSGMIESMGPVVKASTDAREASVCGRPCEHIREQTGR